MHEHGSPFLHLIGDFAELGDDLFLDSRMVLWNSHSTVVVRAIFVRV
jgi:hypothetical protein